MIFRLCCKWKNDCVLACVCNKIFSRMMTDHSFNFIQHLNPVSNKMEWKVVEEDYDYNQEIATSCYGDMLHDEERNQKFGLALEKAIKKMHQDGKKAHVLDIGTGTGLLSMLAVKYGADSVVACEAFLPMANCAVNIIKQNHCGDSIKLVKKHSTSLTVGEDGDLKQRANILVSEVFDTELIGEGAIKTFNHAREHLLEKDCIVIPSSGMVYAQVVESEIAQKWNQLQDWEDDGKVLVKIPEEIKNCPGAAAVHDIQLSQFPQKYFKALSPVVPVFSFNWSDEKPIKTHRQAQFQLSALQTGKAQVVFMWWDLNMDPEGEILLSCAPVWEHPDSKDHTSKNDGNPATHIPWRDHWMQAVYFLSSESYLKQREEFNLISNHDEFSFWFQITKTPTSNSNLSEKEIELMRPVCDCSFHFLLSRTRIGAINDERRRDLYLKNLKKIVNSDLTCVLLGDMSLLGILMAKLGAKEIFILETNALVTNVILKIAKLNQVENILHIHSSIENIVKDIKNPENVLVLSEPFFRNAILPWDNISFWYLKNQLAINGIKTTFPKRGRLKGCGVQFDDLWKISTRLNTCEGFNMTLFDDLIESAKEKAQSYTEAQPLWEYPGIALTTPATLFEFNFEEKIPEENIKNKGTWTFDWDCRCDGVALWMEYDLMDDSTITFGPIKNVVLNDYISWDMYERQGVHLFRNTPKVSKEDILRYDVEFFPETGEIEFYFSFVLNLDNLR